MGGKGTMVGTMLGALIIAVLRNGFSLLSVSSAVQNLVLGLVIIGAVLLDVTRERMAAKARRLAAKVIQSRISNKKSRCKAALFCCVNRYLIIKVLGMGSQPLAGDQKDRHLRFLSSWDSIFLYFLGWRRSETGDRFDMGNGSRVTIACLSQTIRSSQIAYCYTCGLFFTSAT